MPLYFSSFMVPAGAGVPFLMEDKHLKGGFRSVVDIAARDAIPLAARKQGMRVYVISTEETFTINPGSLSTWVNAPSLDAQSSPLDTTPNKALVPGSFGIGGPAIVITDSLDNYTEFNCVVSGVDLDGAPAGGQVLMDVRVGEGYCIQTVFVEDSQETFSRHYLDEDFTSWALDYNSNNQFGLGSDLESSLSALHLDNVDNTRDTDKPISTAAQTQFDAIATALTSKLSSEIYDTNYASINSALENKVDQSVFNSAIAASAYGIKYTWANEAARTAQTGMKEFEQGVQQDTRIVYSYNGTSWAPFYELDAVHNHDSSYLKLTGGALTGDLELVGSSIKKTTVSGTARWLAQDGTGRQHWYWNTEGGNSPKFERGGESALDLYIHTDPNSTRKMVFRAANGDNAAAGDAIVWEDLLTVRSDDSFFYKTHPVHHNGNTFNIGPDQSSALVALDISKGNYFRQLLAITAGITLDATHVGKVIALNSPANYTVSLPSANTLLSGRGYSLFHNNTSGVVTIAATTGQLIIGNWPAAGTQTITLRSGDKITLISDNSNWYIVAKSVAPSTTATANAVVQRDATGIAYASDFIIGSDSKLKENVEPIYGALDIVNQWSGKLYKLINNNSKMNSGFIAQELESVSPHLIYEVDDTKHVAYMQCVPYLAEAIKELTQQIEGLKNAASIRTY